MINFNIRNKDRKLQNVNPDILRATFVAPSTGERVFTKSTRAYWK